MITYNNLDELLYDREGLISDFKESAKDHKNPLTVEELYQNLDYHIETLSWQLEQNTFTRQYHEKAIVNEHTCKKKREIQKPHFFYEQPAHHALIRVLKPIFEKEMYQLSCGSIEGKGPHYGKRYIRKWIDNDPKNCKYFFKFDIKHFFQNVSKRRLKKLLKRKIKDKIFLKKLFTVIDSCETGLPIGYYTSQWFGNYYLTVLDHYIKEEVHAVHMVRYMDDVVIFGRNKKELHKMRIKIQEFLRKELELEMKENWQVCRLIYTDRKGRKHGRPLDLMGFKFYREKTTLRKSNLCRTRRKVNKVKKKDKISFKDAESLLSRMGWLKHTNTYGYYCDYIKPYINIKKLKKIVAKHTRRERQNYEMVQRRKRLKTLRSRRHKLSTACIFQTKRPGSKDNRS